MDGGDGGEAGLDEVFGDGLAELALNRLGGFAGIDGDEAFFRGHAVELFDEGALVGEETVVEIVAVIHVEAGFPVVHFAGFEDAGDEALYAELEIQNEIGLES